jgi:predicted TPR repeat methyltransferase
MLEAARRQGAYDMLVLGELVEHLQATPVRYGLVACADTFIYLGDLSAAWAGVQRVLEPGGCFVFSAERADDGHDFTLTEHLRYAHSERYLRRLAAEQGWTVAHLHRTVLREEQRQPVEGWVVCLEPAARG